MAEDFDYFEDEEGEWDDYESNHDRYREQQGELFKKRTLFEAYMKSKREPFHEMVKRCIYPIFNDPKTSTELLELIAFCLLLNFISTLKFLPKFTVPFTSVVFGSWILIRWFGYLSQSLFLFGIFGFMALCFIQKFSSKKFRLGFLSILYCFIYTCLVQHFALSSKQFTKIRGSLMIMAMKLISLAFDLDNANFGKEKSDLDSNDSPKINVARSKKFDEKLSDEEEKEQNKLQNNDPPTFLEFSSYIFNAASIMFGPWYSFSQHKRFMEQKDFIKILIPTVKGILTLGLCFIFLVCSTCVFDWLILDGYEYMSKALIGYRDAASYRFSHYFVSFLSESAILLTGNVLMTSSSTNPANIYNFFGIFDFHVTKPHWIEWPRSLTEVVVNWNIPMHNWLKTYVFRPSLKFGTFFAVLVTYLASSGLHGFNLQLSAVLLSLGFYTYGEYVLREKLAKSFNACIRARKCQQNCNHKYKFWSPLVLMVNFGFSLLSIYHLLYLGMVFDSSSEQEKGYSLEHTMTKWREFDFISFYIALLTLILAKLV